MEKEKPERIGKFKIIDILGKGGMGDVYKAVQEPLNRIVAVKVLPEEYSRNVEFQKRFITEAKAISKLEHQNIVGIYDYGSDEKAKYIAMRYIEGCNLAQKIAKEKRLEVTVALEYTRQICRALKYAHERDILHRDVKPQNIIIGAKERVFVTDFGIAKIYEQTGFTKTGVVVGTPEYMSPEQAEGLKLNPQTDIYSLGIVLFEMIAGEPPFTGDNPLSIAYKHVNVQPPALSEKVKNVPKQLEMIVLKALKKDRNYRYGNVDEFLEDLDRSETWDSDKTQGMHIVSKVKKKQIFENEKRVVDRRASDRRREPRRMYLRRTVGNINTKKKRIIAVLLIASIVVLIGYLWYYFFWAKRSFTHARGTISKIVGQGHPEYAFDEKIETCWKIAGAAPRFAVCFSSERAVNRIDILAGNNSSQDAFSTHGRPKKILFVFNNSVEFEVELEDSRERQVIIIPERINVEKVDIMVSDVFPGTQSSEICLSEMKFWNSPLP